MRPTLLIALVPLALSACAHAPAETSAPSGSSDRLQALVAASDRTEADRALDPGRKPVEFLSFLEVAPGMKVAELFAGGGYTTELLARAVAPDGVVYGQNSRWVLERFAEKPWSERLSRPVMKNVVRVDRELDDPLPPEATGLDLVVSNAIYHDTVWLNVDREKMNRAVFQALRSGGIYAVCDSSAKPGTGAQDAQTLHRIDEQLVRNEVTKAGFTLVAEGDFLRNPADARDWNAAPGAAGARRGTSDRFCLKFMKPTR
ncbi:MAG: class I SAM-dependent methyltransferase [Myxococcaceae bacterium]|nr:class I SAM-dependent methyltransferase [Myxococcaceae bacterium]